MYIYMLLHGRKSSSTLALKVTSSLFCISIKFIKHYTVKNSIVRHCHATNNMKLCQLEGKKGKFYNRVDKIS